MKYPGYLLLFTILLPLIPGLISAQQNHPMLPATVYPVMSRVHDSLAASRIPMLDVPAGYLDRSVPAVVDNTLNNYWPGYKDQFMFYSFFDLVLLKHIKKIIANLAKKQQ